MLREIKIDRKHFFVDENNLIQGESKEFWSGGGGQLRVHSFYLNGKYHGEFKVNHSNGILWKRCFFQSGELHGEYHLYDRNGNLTYSTFYYHDTDLGVDPSTLTQKDKAYILLSGRLPPKV